jgi:DNA-binding NarL/FixJ family response regulator
VNPRTFSAPGSHPVQRSSAPQYRPHVVFSRDDRGGATRAAAEAARILIVEDEYLVALEMEGQLTEAGFEIVGIAGSAEEAVTHGAAQRHELVIMDIRLKGRRDGIDAALELFAQHGIRCVFVTAHHDAEARARAQAANPLAWLPKPYSMPSLIDVVRRALRSLRDEKK